MQDMTTSKMTNIIVTNISKSDFKIPKLQSHTKQIKKPFPK